MNLNGGLYVLVVYIMQSCDVLPQNKWMALQLKISKKDASNRPFANFHNLLINE